MADHNAHTYFGLRVLEQEKVQGDLYPEVGGALLHPTVDPRVHRVVQKLVEDIASGKAAGGGVPLPDGLAQAGEGFRPPALVQTV